MGYRIKNIALGKKGRAVALMLVFVIASVCLLGACGTKETDANKLGDLEFEVVPEDKFPEELKTIIEERKAKPFKTTFADDNSLYIIVGYGQQPTGGYSIQVKELYETKNAIYIKTEFLGPSKSEEVTQTNSYPYIVIKIEYTDKSVVFK